jgi:hypothetical protein
MVWAGVVLGFSKFGSAELYAFADARDRCELSRQRLELSATELNHAADFDHVTLDAVPTFDISEDQELKRWLVEHMQEGVRKGLLSAALRTVGVIQNEIIPAEKPPPIFDAHYKQAWHGVPTSYGADVYNDMPYAPVLEYGARAENIKIGRKMIDALTEWVRRKGRMGTAPEARADARSAAWAIARAMQGTTRIQGKGIFNRDGVNGLRILEKATRRLREFVGEEIEREVNRMIKGR